MQVGKSAAPMEQYRSGHNGHDWKSCVPQKGTEGSNPSCSARKKNPVSTLIPDFLLYFPYFRRNSNYSVVFFSYAFVTLVSHMPILQHQNGNEMATKIRTGFPVRISLFLFLNFCLLVQPFLASFLAVGIVLGTR